MAIYLDKIWYLEVWVSVEYSHPSAVDLCITWGVPVFQLCQTRCATWAPGPAFSVTRHASLSRQRRPSSNARNMRAGTVEPDTPTRHCVESTCDEKGEGSRLIYSSPLVKIGSMYMDQKELQMAFWGSGDADAESLCVDKLYCIRGDLMLFCVGCCRGKNERPNGFIQETVF